MPANEFNGKVTSQHDARRFRIAPDVVFGRGSDVPLAAGRAAHHHTATYFRGDARLLFYSERDISERAQRDQYQTRVSFNRVDDGFRSALFFRSAAWRRVPVIAQAIASVKPRRAYVRALQWLFRANEHRHLRIAKLRGIERVPAGLIDIYVSRNSGDGQNQNLRRAQRHDQRYGVIGSGIRVN